MARPVGRARTEATKPARASTSAKGAAPAPTIALDVRGGAEELVETAARRRLLSRLGRAMRAAGEAGSEVSLSLTGDAEIHALNRRYADEDKPTDVLSFSQQEGEPLDVPGGPTLLGDIVISVETAGRQAEARGATLDEELLHLAVHGLAHLCGFDHATPHQERVMFGWEARLRSRRWGGVPSGPVPRPGAARA